MCRITSWEKWLDPRLCAFIILINTTHFPRSGSLSFILPPKIQESSISLICNNPVCFPVLIRSRSVSLTSTLNLYFSFLNTPKSSPAQSQIYGLPCYLEGIFSIFKSQFQCCLITEGSLTIVNVAKMHFLSVIADCWLSSDHLSQEEMDHLFAFLPC